MSDGDTAVLALAERFFRAIEAGDRAAVARCYADDAVVWHNNDGVEQSAPQNLRVLDWVIRTVTDRHYDVKRREAFPGGFFQQHVLSGTLPDGTRFTMPACIVCLVTNGQIARLDEYLDSGQTAPLSKFVRRAGT